MNHNDLIAVEVDESDGQIARALDLGTPRPIEAEGGDVVFAPVLERTDDDAALEPTGEDRPVATTSVYSERDLRAALRDAGYSHDAIDHALAVRLRGENGCRAARIAESRTHDHPAQLREESVATGEGGAKAVTDGGRETCEWCGETPAAGSQRELHTELPDEVGAGVLCTSRILEDDRGEFAELRETETDR